ncbi:hypothetical protein F4561_002865 [Lipingzhangella halophila]|uniref:Uncharacterized protein n=1 Tax=Lipingzhangella halophila TaxID=1783352 RepID=A0A7W7RHK7_9ACTN|nr:hypothetical protein [Lipingzhangella halophila]MBB4932045.1 hypothetical protein [Lipingzhangella halophila]
MVRFIRRAFPVFPEYGRFRLAGPGARQENTDIAELLGGSLLASGYDHIELSTLQGRVDVSVVLEEWDAEPPDPENPGWEEAAAATVFLRGFVTVGGGVPGYAVNLRLRSGARLYRADVHAWRRRAVAQRYDQLLRSYGDPHSARFRAAEKQLRGQEEFLIRLRPTASDDGTSPRGGNLCSPETVAG